MGITNQININPKLESLRSQIASMIEKAVSDLAIEVNGIKDVTEALSTEINENQALIEGLSTVSGEIDTSSTAINNHTTAKSSEVLSALVDPAADKLLGLIVAAISSVKSELIDSNFDVSNAVRDNILEAVSLIDLSALDESVSSRATPKNITDARSAIVTAINAIDLSRLDVNVSSRATPSDVNTASNGIKAELVRTSSGSLYQRVISAITTLINTVAKPSDVANAQVSIEQKIEGVTAASESRLLSKLANFRRRKSTQYILIACSGTKTGLRTQTVTVGEVNLNNYELNVQSVQFDRMLINNGAPLLSMQNSTTLRAECFLSGEQGFNEVNIAVELVEYE